MSAIEALLPTSRTADRVAARPQRENKPGLRLLPSRRTRMSRFPFILSLVAMLAAGMGGLVVVNTQIQLQATELASLQQEATNLEYQQAQAQAEVNKLRSASSLEVQAYKLGLRPNPRPAFVVLPDGKILGTPTKVTGKELPAQVYLTWEQAVKQQEQARAAVAQEKAAQAKKAADEAARKKAADEAAAKKKAADEAAKKKAADEAAAKKKAADEAAAKKKAAEEAAKKKPTAKPTGGR